MTDKYASTDTKKTSSYFLSRSKQTLGSDELIPPPPSSSPPPTPPTPPPHNPLTLILKNRESESGRKVVEMPTGSSMRGSESSARGWKGSLPDSSNMPD
ncbi:hypothetical protein EYF80_037729 [Liparis tanakae]|uniref:Uncharacterized protein n=1 Tax=Liparis tanakae TaxID=230148 RepID=A0A4Z2GF96_9TELE|nr:hypothetical protein EYF80_037729 [Liparis tanakae]